MIHIYILYLVTIIGAGVFLIRQLYISKSDYFWFFFAFTLLQLITLIIYYIGANIKNAPIYLIYSLNYLTSVTFILFIISLVNLEYKTHKNLKKILIFYSISGIFVLFSIPFAMIIKENKIITISPFVEILNAYLVLLLALAMFGNILKKNKTKFENESNIFDMICLPLIALDIFLQDRLPIKLFPFIYLLYTILYSRSIKKNSSVETIHKIIGLSPREEEVVNCILKGKSNKQISDELFISVPTVKTHITNIFKKTGVKSRFELVGLTS